MLQFMLFAIRILGLGCAGAFAIAPAQAQSDFPRETIQFVSGYTVGSGADIIVRFFSERVARISGGSVIVLNKPGATGNIATEFVARSKPTGHTVLVHAGSGMAGNMHLYPGAAVNAVRDLQLVATINRQGTLLVVDSRNPARNLADLIAALRARTGAKYGTSSTSGTITGEMFRKVGGVDVTLVNYRSNADSLRDLAGGQIDFVMVDPLLALAEHRKGTIRFIALSTPQPMASLPGLQTFHQAGLDMDLTGWWAAAVPKDTPRPIVDKLNGWFKQILETAEAQKFLVENGAEAFISTPDEAQQFLVKSVKDWESYIKLANLDKK